MLRTLLILALVGQCLAEENRPTLDDVMAILEAERPKVLTHEERLTEFYKEHNPTKMDQVPKLLKKFEGREEAMFPVLELKYVKLFGDKNGDVKHLNKDGQYEKFQEEKPNMELFYYPDSLGDETKERYGELSTKYSSKSAFGAVDCSKASAVCDEIKVTSDDASVLKFFKNADSTVDVSLATAPGTLEAT